METTMTTERSVTHATFVIERTYDASPARVFGAFANPAIKARWFGSDDAPTSHYELDFRVGGLELSRGRLPDGPVYVYEARFQDIVPDQRIVTTYEMYMDDTRISVSVATVELKPDGQATRLVFTEQGAYLDGHDTPAQREHGTRELLNALGAELERTSA
jgi:uncharacterized protein YndB with AHSA1/START domain